MIEDSVAAHVLADHVPRGQIDRILRGQVRHALPRPLAAHVEEDRVPKTQEHPVQELTLRKWLWLPLLCDALCGEALVENPFAHDVERGRANSLEPAEEHSDARRIRE